MRWADISRFPGGILRLLYTLYGLLLQISTIGAGGAAAAARRARRRPRPARRASRYGAAWMLAVPVLTLTAALMLETGALLGAVAFDDSPILAAVIVVTVALVALGFAALGGDAPEAGRVAGRADPGRRRSWRCSSCARRVVGAPGGPAAWASRTPSSNVVTYPFRIAWLVVGGGRRARGDRPGRDGLPPGGAGADGRPASAGGRR